MSDNKLVSRAKLNNFYINLAEITFDCKDIETRDKLKNLSLYFEKHIIEKSSEDVAELKRYIYTKMKNTTGEDNKILYEIYQGLKNIK